MQLTDWYWYSGLDKPSEARQGLEGDGYGGEGQRQRTFTCPAKGIERTITISSKRSMNPQVVVDSNFDWS